MQCVQCCMQLEDQRATADVKILHCSPFSIVAYCIIEHYFYRSQKRSSRLLDEGLMSIQVQQIEKPAVRKRTPDSSTMPCAPAKNEARMDEIYIQSLHVR